MTQLEVLRNEIQVQQQHQETQQLALHQLIKQMQDLTQSLSLNTSNHKATNLEGNQ